MDELVADSILPLPDAVARKRRRGVFDFEYDRFRHLVGDGGRATLDLYGAEHPSEFFAVAAEAFFVKPQQMRAGHPLLAQYLEQDRALPLPRAGAIPKARANSTDDGS